MVGKEVKMGNDEAEKPAEAVIERIRTEMRSAENSLKPSINVIKKELEQLEKLIEEKEYYCAKTRSQEIEKWARRIYEILNKIDSLSFLLGK